MEFFIKFMGKINRVGETIRAKNGQMMTIIAYYSANNIDIQFEDSTIVRHRKYQHFKNGSIANPNTNIVGIGTIATSKSGEKMRIIARRSGNDLDVMFEDGTIVKNVLLVNFKNGNVVNPNSMVGKSTIANNGQVMTLIAYRSNKDVDIRFEDDTIVYHKRYAHFKQGCIANPNRPNEQVREIGMSNDNQRMIVFEYHNGNNVDVMFEDGVIVKHKRLVDFKNGCIVNPEKRIGEQSRASNGQMMTIIAYRNNKDIDILFDDNVIVSHKRYDRFKKGYIRKSDTSNHLGETVLANNGQRMTIVGYRTSKDIDVCFEDETIVYHKQYINFKSGEISNPNYYPANNNQRLRLGETVLAKNGKHMTIIAYRNCMDIDIMFEDGTPVYHKSYHDFKAGDISHPKEQLSCIRVGEQSRARNGQMMTIIAYRNNRDIDVRFEDDTIVRHKRYKYFKSGQIGNPNYKMYGKKSGVKKNSSKEQTAKYMEKVFWETMNSLHANGVHIETTAYGTSNYRAEIHTSNATNAEVIICVTPEIFCGMFLISPMKPRCDGYRDNIKGFFSSGTWTGTIYWYDALMSVKPENLEATLLQVTNC